MSPDDGVDAGDIQPYGGDAGELCDLPQREHGTRQIGDAHYNDASLRYVPPDDGVDAGDVQSYGGDAGELPAMGARHEANRRPTQACDTATVDAGDIQPYGGDAGELRDLPQREHGARQIGDAHYNDASLRYVPPDDGVDASDDEPHGSCARELCNLPQREHGTRQIGKSCAKTAPAIRATGRRRGRRRRSVIRG